MLTIGGGGGLVVILFCLVGRWVGTVGEGGMLGRWGGPSLGSGHQRRVALGPQDTVTNILPYVSVIGGVGNGFGCGVSLGVGH